MSAKDISFYRDKIKKMGRWMAPRYLRNRGISFEQAYFIIFDRMPKMVTA